MAILFLSPQNNGPRRSYRRFLLGSRDAIAAQFREQYGSTTSVNGAGHANVFPYFIGVFDTVAALGHKYLGAALVTAGIALLIGLHWLGGFLQPVFPWADGWPGS